MSDEAVGTNYYNNLKDEISAVFFENICIPVLTNR